MFVLSSDITIGNFRFSGVNEVHIRRSIHGIEDIAVIKLPSISKVLKNGTINQTDVVTGKQFSDGDKVTIKLGYDGILQTEFEGFVRQRNLSMPLEVICEGYSWLLRRNTINQFWSRVSVKELLQTAVTGIDPSYNIEVQCNEDIILNNLRINNKSGFDVISHLEKITDGGLTCFFIQPNLLWCGTLYSSFAEGNNVLSDKVVQYRLGYNCIKDNLLKERLLEDDPVTVRYFKKLGGGRKITATSAANGYGEAIRSKILNHISDAGDLQLLADEKSRQLNYLGYDGSINSFLQPFAAPGYEAFISDSRYPENDGNYLIESTEVRFGIGGARRIMEIGPKSGFAND